MSTDTGAETIAITVDGRGVAQVTLTRPDQHNAMNAAMIDALTKAADRLAADSAVRVVVLTGAGESFCAGGDLAWMQAQAAAPLADRTAGARALAEMLAAWNTIPKPVIARVNGQAYGGGVGLLSVCDIALAVEGAMFGLTETRLGLVPATIGPYVLRRIGASAARRLILSGRRFDAAEALRVDLLSAVVAAADLDTAIAREVAAHLAAAPGAIAAAKAQILAASGPVTQAEIDASITALVARWEGPESVEGLDAFFARRRPAWAERDRG